MAEHPTCGLQCAFFFFLFGQDTQVLISWGITMHHTFDQQCYRIVLDQNEAATNCLTISPLVDQQEVLLGHDAPQSIIQKSILNTSKGNYECACLRFDFGKCI